MLTCNKSASHILVSSVFSWTLVSIVFSNDEICNSARVTLTRKAEASFSNDPRTLAISILALFL